MGSGAYSTAWGKVHGGDLIEIATGPQTGGTKLCKAEYLGVRLPPAAVVTHDDAIKETMKSAVAKFEELCPKAAYRVNVGTYNTEMEWHTMNFRAEPTARASVMLGTTKLEQYVNKAVTTARQKDRQGAFEAKCAAGQQAFDIFSAKNGITAWVTTEQLDQNPFNYEGEVVGVFVKLDRMLSRDTALVESGIQDGYGEVEPRGVTPDFPGDPKVVMVAVKVGKQEKLDVLGVFKTTITAVDGLDSFTCTERECDDCFAGKCAARRSCGAIRTSVSHRPM